MTNGSLLNVIFFTAVLALSGFIGFLGFSYPQAVQGAGGSVIAALSVIFGLSAVALTVVENSPDQNSVVSNDPEVSRLIIGSLKRSDERTVQRLMVLHGVALIAILNGIVFLGAYAVSPDGAFSKASSLLFSALSTFALVSTLLIPGMINNLVTRNRSVRKDR